MIRRAQASLSQAHNGYEESSRTETELSNKDNCSVYMQNLEQIVEMGACPSCQENMTYVEGGVVKGGVINAY